MRNQNRQVLTIILQAMAQIDICSSQVFQAKTTERILLARNCTTCVTIALKLEAVEGGKILTDTLHMLTSSQPAVDEISGANLAAGKKYVVKVTALDSKGEALKQLVKVTKNKKSISVMKQPLSKVKATGKARKNLTFALRKLSKQMRISLR